MLAVVYLHVAAPSLRQFAVMPVWHFSNLLTSLCTAAVPIFFMISGALLLSDPKTADLAYLAKHRLPRILVPFVLWSILNVLYMVKIEDMQSAKYAIFYMLSKPVVIPYWYIYALIPLYLLSPLLKKMTEALTSEQLYYLLLLWGVSCVLLPTLQRLVPASVAPCFSVHETYHVGLDGGYAGYFFLGYALDRAKRRCRNRTLMTVIVLDVLLIAAGTRHASIGNDVYSEQFKSYLSMYCVILAAAVFLLVKNLCAERKTRTDLWRQLSGASYCIYLAHVKIITTLHLFVVKQNFATIWTQLAFYALTVLVSLACALILASIKPFCWLLTGQKYRNAFNLHVFVKRKRERQSTP